MLDFESCMEKLVVFSVSLVCVVVFVIEEEVEVDEFFIDGEMLV